MFVWKEKNLMLAHRVQGLWSKPTFEEREKITL
jgi:hypothetical protein